MDKRTIIGMVVMLAIFAAWQLTLTQIGKKHPEWILKKDEPTPPPATAPSTQSTGAVATTQSTTQSTTQGVVTTAPAIPAVAGYHVLPGTGEPIVLGSVQHNDPNYPIGLALSPRGAAISSVTLNNFKKEVRDPALFQFQTPYLFPDSDYDDALATRWVKINGNQIDLHSVTWNLQPGADAKAAIFSIDIADNLTEKPLLRILKTYWVTQSNDPGKGYEVGVKYDYQNLSGAPLKVQASFNGPNAPDAEVGNRNDAPSVIGGYNNDGTVSIKNLPVAGFTEKQKEVYFSTHFEWHNLWMGMTSAYFSALIQPDDKSTLPVENIRAFALNPGADKPENHRAAITFETRESAIAPNAAATTAMTVYLGPKQRAILNSDYYSSFPRSYDKTLVLTSGFCSICTFTWLVDVLVNMLRAFHYVLRDWGLSIIVLVCLVRLLLHPITKRFQISMSRMTKMGPEMEKLKKKYADDPDGLRKQQAELIREQGITPILGCLPMFLQMPIWIALYQSLQTTFELRQAPFLWNLTWIKDLSKADSIITFHNGGINLYFYTLVSLNILPLFMAVVFFIQQKMTPKPVAATKEQEQQQKMMQWMSLLFPVMLYTGPAGLNLYILTSTGIGIIESKRIRDHIKEREEAEKAGKIIVDAPQGRNAKRLANEAARKTPKKEGWLTNIIANMHAKMEEAQKEAEKRKKGKK